MSTGIVGIDINHSVQPYYQSPVLYLACDRVSRCSTLHWVSVLVGSRRRSTPI